MLEFLRNLFWNRSQETPTEGASKRPAPAGQPRAESWLNAGEEYFKQLVAGVQDYAVFLLDPQGTIVTWNTGAERIKGYTAKEVIGTHFSRFYPKEAIERDWPAEELRRAAAEGRIEDEGWRIRQDGTQFWANVIITALRDQAGKLQGYLKITRDLTKRKATEEALRLSEERFRLLVEGVQDYAIFMLDSEGRITSWNPGAQRIKGYRAEEIIGQHFSRFYPPEAIERGWPDHELRVARAQGRFEDEDWRIRSDGTRFWANVVITALHDEAGNFRGFAKMTRDLTERKRSEENARRLAEEAAARRVAEENARIIQEQRERLQVTLTSIGDAVISTDAQGRVTFLNPIAESLTGWKAEEATNQMLPDVFRIVNEDTREPVENPALRALKEGAIVGLANHTVLISRDGVERPIDDSAAPIRDASGSILGSVLVFRDITERRESQERLRHSEERFRSLMEQAPFSIQVFSPDGKTIRVNRAWEELWGVRLEQIKGYNILNDPQLESKGILKYIRQGFAGQPARIPAIQYDPSETIPGITKEADPRRWLSAVIYPIKDTDDRVREVVLIYEDISARHRAEESLRQSEQRFRQLADAMPQIVWTAGPDGQIDYLNHRWTEFTGLPGTSSNDAWSQILHPDDTQPAHERWAASLRNSEPFEMELRLLNRQDQTYRWHLLRTVPFKDETGRVARWYGTATDIHGQKRAEESARYLAEASAALASVVDYESTMQKVAHLAVPHFADWSAVDVAEEGNLRRLAVAHQDPAKINLLHQLMREYPPDPHVVVGAYAVLRSGKPEFVPEITDDMLISQARDERHLHLLRALNLKSYICVPLIISGKTLGLLTFATADSGRRYNADDLSLAMDLTHRAAVAVENTQLYQALKETDRRKDEFLATLAHELRNPLAPIRNSLQILKMPWIDSETAERSREMMERQVHHLVRLVDDLLDVSRVMRGKIELRKERIELASVVARAVETVQPLIDAQRHQLSVILPPDSLPIDADPVRLVQVIGNLLTNAAKYTEPGGHIWLSAGREGDMAILRVRDTGIGIAEEMLPRIFELFVQVDHAAARSQGGLGIGLTLVKNLVEMHNGTVEAYSEGLGKGSEFVVRLPLAVLKMDSINSRRDGSQGSESPSPSGHQLLVVDDNQDAANSLATLLRLQGHEVRVAYSGVAALEMTKEYRPDVVFLDIGMPGMDGYEVARRLRQQPGLSHVILAALTGWGQHEDRRRSAEAGFNHHLVKPPEPQALEQVLSQLSRKS